ncbi:lysophospholipid acyltransferase family protein [soil metagenome]
MKPEKISFMYRFAMRVLSPLVKWWGRLEADGVEALPATGPILLAGNHDSYWDPVAIGIAGLSRRQIRALAKSTLWKVPGLGPILNGMGQVPIERGAGDSGALSRAVEELRGGACIGVFPEGTTTRGRELRARSGFGRLALQVPEAKLICCTVTGTVDIARFPKRPRIRVRFFDPAEGDLNEGEEAGELSQRLMAEIRAEAPIEISGRSRKVARHRKAIAAEREAELATLTP